VAAGDTAVVTLCVCAEPLVAVGAVFVVELFFFAFAVDVVVCAVAIDAVTRKALIQKLAANFK
jgi:hypothetical protein